MRERGQCGHEPCNILFKPRWGNQHLTETLSRMSVWGSHIGVLSRSFSFHFKLADLLVASTPLLYRCNTNFTMPWQRRSTHDKKHLHTTSKQLSTNVLPTSKQHQGQSQKYIFNNRRFQRLPWTMVLWS